MALGFQDCCNQYSFFNVVGIPSTVSEYEVYYIRTVEGINFCATYREIPVLNYIPPSYVLLEMTQQTDCAVCIEANPCPVEETIFINQFLEGSVVVGTDCSVRTLRQMFVECRSTNPTFDDQTDGIVALFVTGGTPPYTFFSADTQEVLSTTMVDDVYTVFPNATEGPYNMVVVDDAGDFIIPITCVLDAPPNLPIIVPIMTPASFYNAPDGSIRFDITGGNPPYTVIYEGEIITGTLRDLPAGTYIFQVLDLETYQEVSVEVTQPDPLDFADALCVQFTLCGTEFKITMVKTEEFLFYRPIYRSTNSSQIGVISFDLKYVKTQFTEGWTVQPVPVQREDIRFTTPPGNCTNLNNPTFSFFGLANQLPQGFYLTFIGILTGVNVVVVPGGCPPSLTAEVTEGYCAGPPVSLGKVQLEAFGGAGPPYTFFYSAGNGGAYTQTTSSILELVNGTYALKVRDALGAESTPISVTVPTVSNLFRGNQVGFCSVIEPESPGVRGTLTPLQEGEYREFDVTVSKYFDFGTLPEGAIINGKFGLTFTNSYVGGDDGYNNIQDNPVEMQFEVLQTYLLEGSNRTDINRNDWTISGFYINNDGTVQPNPDEGSILGGNIVFGQNYGYFVPIYNTDQCTGYTETLPARTSPNYWYTCENLIGYSSLIEGDLRGMQFINYYTLKSQRFDFTSQTKFFIKIRVKMKNNIPVYIPTTLNETDISTLQPLFYDPAFASLLNQPNTQDITLGGYSNINVSYTLYDTVVKERPPSPPCWNLFFPFGQGPQGGNFPGIGNQVNPQNPTSNGTPRFTFYHDTSLPNNMSYYNQFVVKNNTCVGIPSWAQ